MPETNSEPHDAEPRRAEARAGGDTENPVVVPEARRDPAAERARRLRLAVTTLFVVAALALCAWAYLDRDDVDADTASGFITGMATALLVFLAVVWWGMRRGGTSFSRFFLGRADERDQEVWRRAWAFTGKVACFAVFLLMICELWGADLRPPLSAALWVNIVALYGSRFYYDRRM